MEMLHDYLLYNWVLILIVVAFIVVLITTAFLDNKSTKRLYFLVGEVFLLSIVVFIEFYYEGDPNYNLLRLILMSIRYSATPLMLEHVIFALVKKAKGFSLFQRELFLSSTSFLSLPVLSLV